MAPKPMKRPAASTAGNKPTRRRTRDVVAAQCDSITAALNQAPGLTEELRRMLVRMVPASLGVYKDVRHDFQHRATTMIEEALNGIEERLKSDLKEAQIPVDRASQDKEERTNAVVAAEAKLVECSAQVVEARAGLDFSAESLKTAKTALAACTAEQKEGDAVLTQALEKKARLEEVHRQTFERVRDEGAKKEDIVILAKVGKGFQFDASLLASMGPALEKEPGARGPFDAVIVEKLGSEFSKAIEGLETVVQEQEPGRAQRAAAVSSAEASLSAATAANDEARARLANAVANERDGKATRKAAEIALASYMTDLKKTMDVFDEAQRLLAEFQRGPWAAFVALKDLTTPPDSEDQVQEDAGQASLEKDVPVKVVGEEEAPVPQVA